MHDGRFATLREVVHFYDDMLARASPGDPELCCKRIELNEEAIDNFASFSESLTAD